MQREITKAEAIRSMKKLEIKRNDAKNQETLEKRNLTDFDHPLQPTNNSGECSFTGSLEGASNNSVESVAKSIGSNLGDDNTSNNNNLKKSNSLLLREIGTLVTCPKSPDLLSGNKKKSSPDSFRHLSVYLSFLPSSFLHSILFYYSPISSPFQLNRK